MDQKKRNSILRTTIKEDEQTTDFNARLKRRISFSERKSVRVFSHEEEPKTWDNSYELSDRGESSNNSNTKTRNSSEIQTQSSSTLCTTNEFIDKVHQGDIFIEHSLAITLTEYESKTIKHGPQNPTKKADETNLKNKTLAHELENKKVENPYHIPARPASTSTAPNFVYINENSNKENIAPETYEIQDANNTKKAKSSDTEEANMANINSDTSNGNCPKDIVTTSNEKKNTLEADAIDRSYAQQNVSGICPISISPPTMSNESTPSFCSPLVSSDSLPKCSKKKLDFLQINEALINGRLKLFPNIEKHKSPPKLIKNDDIDVEQEQTLSTPIDIESAPDLSKGAIPKKRQTTNRTTYIQTSVESTFVDPEVKNRKTVYFDDCIESDYTKTNPSVLEKGYCSLSSKTEAMKTAHFERNVDNNSSMDLIENSDNNCVDKRVAESDKNTIINRRTIYFENEIVETEKLNYKNNENSYQENIKLNEESHVSNNRMHKNKLSFLRTPSIEQMDITDTSNIDQDNNYKEPSKNRYTHHFDKSNIVDITCNSNEVVDEIEAISNAKSCENIPLLDEKNECVIPETQPMEFTRLANPVENKNVQIPEKRRTHYFNENEKINITNDINETTQDPKLLRSSEKNTYYFNNTEIMNVSRNASIEIDTESVSKYNATSFESSKFIDLEVKSTEKLNKKPYETRKTVYFGSDDSLNLTSTKTEQLKTQEKELSCINAVSKNVSKTNLIKRFTHLFNDTNALINSIEEYNKKEQQEYPEIPTFKKPTNRETLHFKNDEIMMDATNQIENEPIEDFLHTPSKIQPKHQNMKLSVFKDFSRFNTFSPATPHRSVIEFLRLEREANEAEEFAGDNTFTTNDESLKDTNTKTLASQKRSTSNLTPNLPASKKRQSVSCSNLNLTNPTTFLKDMQLSVNESSVDNSKIQDHSFMEGLVPIPESQESSSNKHEEILSRPAINIVDMQETLTNENIENYSQIKQELITPSRTDMRSSRIPIYTESAKKKNITRISSPNMKSVLNLDFSLQTVEMPRFVVNNDEDRNISKFMVLDGLTNEFNLSTKKLSTKNKSVLEFEDNPITISDVTEHYLTQKHQKQRRTRTSDASENKKDHLIESLFEIIDSDEIDKTKLELVDTLLDETFAEHEEDFGEVVIQQSNHNNCDEKIIQNKEEKEEPSCKLALPQKEDSYKNNSLLCRKCKRCQHSVLNETASTETNESFVMPPMPTINFTELREKFFNDMEKMERGPTLATVNEFYERMQLQNSIESLNITTDEDIEEEDTDEDPDFQILREYRERSEQFERDLKARLSKPVAVRKTFINRLKDLFSGENTRNWIVNAEMRQMLRFRHRQMYTFCILLQYEKVDPFGEDIIINSISLEDSSVPKRTWTPYDFMAHFQLQLELPYSLRSLCTGNSETNIYEMLIKIDEICKNVVRMSKEVWRIVVDKDGSLIRENNQTIIRKMNRKIINDSDGLYQCTEKTEFRIEVTNLKTFCFKDIIMPPVYMFREDIENLPAGLDFLHIFLKNPVSFLKNDNI